MSLFVLGPLQPFRFCFSFKIFLLVLVFIIQYLLEGTEVNIETFQTCFLILSLRHFSFLKCPWHLRGANFSELILYDFFFPNRFAVWLLSECWFLKYFSWYGAAKCKNAQDILYQTWLCSFFNPVTRIMLYVFLQNISNNWNK